MITFNKAYQEAISKYGKDDIRSVAHFMFQKGIESALKPIDDLKPGDKVVLRDIAEMRLIRGNTDMTANDYSIEKYVSEYLKPLEEKGIITDLRVIPCRCRIMFRLNEPSRENSMKVIIETETDEDHITFFKSDVSAEETFRSPERRFIYQRLMAANKSLNDELNRMSVNTDLYITKYLKPLEEKGLIKDLATCKNHSVWFTMVKDIKGVSITVNLIPGTTVDTVAFFPLPIDINGNGVVTTFITNPINNDHYTENLEKRIQESMSELKVIFDNPLPE